MTTVITIPPVPLLPAALIHSTASTTVLSTTLPNTSNINLIPGTITSHVQIMVVALSTQSVSNTVTVNGQNSGITVGSNIMIQFGSDILLTDVVWTNNAKYGQYTILTIELPTSVTLYAPNDISTTLTLDVSSNGDELLFSAVQNNGNTMHHRLLAGVPIGQLPGFPTITNDDIKNSSKYGYGTPLAISTNITMPENSLSGDNLLIVSFYIECLPGLPDTVCGSTYCSYESALQAISQGVDTLGYTCTINDDEIEVTIVENSSVIDLSYQYQVISVMFSPGVPLPAPNSIIVLTMSSVLQAVSGFNQLNNADGTPLVTITPSSTKTRPVGYCTAATPDYYDWGLGAYLGADFATGNCVTQRSSSTDCRNRSMCIINTQTIIGNTSKILDFVSLGSPFSPLSPDMGFSAGTPSSNLPKPFPTGFGKELSAVPPHLKARTELFGTTTCPGNKMYYIPQNTQKILPCGNISLLYDLYSVSVCIGDDSGCAESTVCAKTESSFYPSLGQGANGCSTTSAVCVPGTSPTVVGDANPSYNYVTNTYECHYICEPCATVCDPGFQNVAEYNTCMRVLPSTLTDMASLESNNLCQNMACTFSDPVYGTPSTCVPNDTVIKNKIKFNHGWQQDPGSCVPKGSHNPPLSTDCSCLPGGSEYCVVGPISVYHECMSSIAGDELVNVYSINDTIGTASNPIPQGYYYWQYGNTPSDKLFDTSGVYSQVLCDTVGGCTDAIPSYSLAWEGGWVADS